MAMHVIYSAGTVTPMGSPRGSPIATPHGSPIFPHRYSPNHTPRGSPRTSPRKVKHHPTSPLTESAYPLIKSGSNNSCHSNGDDNHHHHHHTHHHYHRCLHPHVHMPKDDNDLKNTIPAMSRPLAITLIICNVLSPGLGTFLSGLSVLCCSKVRSKGGNKWRVIWVNSWVALLQFMTAFLFLLGWIWSIMWAANFLEVSKEDETEHFADLEKAERSCVCLDPAITTTTLETGQDTRGSVPVSVAPRRKSSALKTVTSLTGTQKAVTSLVPAQKRPVSLTDDACPHKSVIRSNGNGCATTGSVPCTGNACGTSGKESCGGGTCAQGPICTPTIVLQDPSMYNSSAKTVINEEQLQQKLASA